MKRLFLHILALLAGALNHIHAQYLYMEMPVIKKPELTPTLYQTLKSEYLVKNTKSFDLKGNVKTITETITPSANTKLPVQNNKYEFTENNKLSYYREGDTLQSWVNSRAKIWQYRYDAGNNKLAGMIHFDGLTQNSRRTEKKLDDDGFAVQEISECFGCGYDKEKDKYVFDYTLNYRWSKRRDTVYRDYAYKVPSAHYQRFSNSYSAFDSTGQMNRMKLFHPFEDNVIKYDKKGNIISWMMIDRAIKNSFNVDHLYEYTYNERNELAEVVFSTFIHNGQEKNQGFRVQCRDEIEALEYDAQGNWVLKKVKRRNFRGDSEFIYKREITYY